MQITTAYGTRGDGPVLARNRYVALNLAKPSKAKQPLSPYQKPCKHIAEAIVVDGAERGHTVKVCAEPSCTIHFADRANKTPNPEQLAKEREQRRKQLEKQKLEITIRHRTLAELLKRITSPLERADLGLVANAMLEKTEPLHRETLARRHKVVDGSASEVTYPQVQKGLALLLRQSDENGLSKLIVEIALLGSLESASHEGTDVLAAAAKRHRIDVEKVRRLSKRSLPPSKQSKLRNRTRPPKRARPGSETRPKNTVFHLGAFGFCRTPFCFAETPVLHPVFGASACAEGRHPHPTGRRG